MDRSEKRLSGNAVLRRKENCRLVGVCRISTCIAERMRPLVAYVSNRQRVTVGLNDCWTARVPRIQRRQK